MIASTYIVFLLLGGGYAVLLSSLPVKIFPEFFFYPWLVSRGLVQYRDFFDHHGFLTNIILAPLVNNISNIAIVFIAVQLAQYGFVFFLIYKKVKKPLILFLLSLMYLSFQYVVVGQTIWYDEFIALLLIAAWYLMENKKERISFFCIACATMIKPTALPFVVPFYIKAKNGKSILVFITAWIIALTYFFCTGALKELWKQLFVFNYLYIPGAYLAQPIIVPLRLLISIWGCFGVIVLLSFYKGKKVFALVFTTIIASLSYFLGFIKLNFALFAPFFTLLIAENEKKQKIYVLLMLLFLNVVFIREGYKVFNELKNSKPYLSNEAIREGKQILSLIKYKKDKNVLIIGNRVELYYLLNTLPPEFTPIHFPWVTKVYPNPPSLNGIRYIIVPKKLAQYETLDITINRRLNKDFKQIGDTNSFRIFEFNAP